LLNVFLRAFFHADPIFQITDRVLLGAVGAAVEFAIPHFHAVTDDLAAAVGAAGRHGMDGTFKAIERATFAALDDLK
jgi:hypothetical protein